MGSGLAQPGGQAVEVHDVLGNVLVVEGLNQRLINKQVHAASLLLELFNLSDQALIVVVELQPGIDLSAHQPLTNQEGTGVARLLCPKTRPGHTATLEYR